MDQDNLVSNEELDEDLSTSWGSMGVPNQMGNTSRRSDVSVQNSSHHPISTSPGVHQGDLGGGVATEMGDHQEMTSGQPLRNANDVYGLQDSLKEMWEINYKEAAIFLEEGINNDKFTNHPHSHEALPAYLLVHNKWFHLIDLSASLLLLFLGFFEQPCLQPFCVPAQIHSSIELCLLILVAIQVFLKTRWVGWTTCFRHKRTLIKVGTLVVMLLEAIVVLIRANNHFRVTRALRPIFLIDNHYCGGVRRFIRQILQSLPPILDMLGLVFFVMIIFSVFGFYLFGVTDMANFGSLKRSFISLFVLLTTANYPDVMMKSYEASRFSALFFIAYLSINLYFLMNLMLAVVYDAFTRIEKAKFKRLYLHKRKAAQHAFKLLVTKDRKNEIKYHSFEGLLKHYKGVNSPTEAYLVFKLLNTSNSGYLTMDEFYDIYDACLYSWNIFRASSIWYFDMWSPVRRVLDVIRRAVLSLWFEYAICFFVLANGMILIVQTWVMERPSSAEAQDIYAPWVSYFFVGLYTLEASLKLLGLGITAYFSSFWNIFDFSITTLGILSLILQTLDIPLFYVIILRPLRLLTLFRMKKRYRDVFGTAIILYPRLISAVIVLLLIYYFFGIIGMECFNKVDLVNCCKNTSVETYYNYDGNGAPTNGLFYLNNFESLVYAGVTLFELTVVNNWYVIMEGFAFSTGTDWSRLFFMIFYIFTMIVITIIVAFILEAFLFRIQYKQFLTKHEEQKKLSAEITLTSIEMDKIVQRSGQRDVRIPRNFQFKFEGIKSRTKEQLQLLMYTDELDSWIAEARQEEANSQARVQAALFQASINNDRMTNFEEADNERDMVVHDDGEVTTILRPVLPDVHGVLRQQESS